LPPLSDRPWALSEEGRKEKLGLEVECVLCARLELPEDLVCYRQTEIYDSQTIPDGLRRNHTTKRGVWGRIEVLEGTLRYVIEPPFSSEQQLSQGQFGIVPPEQPHRVEPVGAVRMRVHFLRKES
jgi:tellurite methyltransferase